MCRPKQSSTKLGSLPLTAVALAALLSVARTTPALATAVPPSLGSAGGYAVLATNASPTVGEVTCTKSVATPIVIDGNVGTTFTSITNTGCTITGAIDAPVAGSVVTDFNNAYSALNTLNPVCDGPIPTTSTTILPGVYCSAAGTTIGAGVTFTLNGNASDVWVFKVGTTAGSLTGNSFQVVMGGTALACNVYWWTQGAATMTDSNFIGTILAGSAITLTRGNYLGRAMATTDFTDTNVAPFTFAGCAPPASITVNKIFSPSSAATVPVALTCTSGSVILTPLNAAEGTPAVFSVGGGSTGATCTATETVPLGYSANQSGCVGVALGGSCTITNTLNPSTNTITVNKVFSPSSAATVPVALTCTSGTVNTTPLNASETTPAVFTVTGASGGATCTATETVPAGYTGDQTNCVGVALDGSCTITNTIIPNTHTITVNKVFSPPSGATVAVALTCTSGSVSATPLNASTAIPAVFTVTGASSGATCRATETVPAGYTGNQTNCTSVSLDGSCTITNTLKPNTSTITVNKVFSPASAATVPVALACTSGTVNKTPLNASVTTPAVFTVTGASTGATCTATETVPAGYTANQTTCVDVALPGNCTITNTLNANTSTITVSKIFSPTSLATVPVALTCTSGTVNATPLNAAEGAPAVFTVTGASAGATCTATEAVPPGYSADQAPCVSVALDGNCTITNTRNAAPVPANVSTLSGWGMIMLAGFLALAGLAAIRRIL